MQSFTKHCHKCGSVQSYKRKSAYVRSVRLNIGCWNCRWREVLYTIVGDGTVVMGLQNGMTATIDVSDLECVTEHRWHAWKGRHTWYVVVNTSDGKRIYLHRLLMKANKDELIDHEDRNGLNNVRSNLRRATPSQNTFNGFGWKGRRYKGVSFRKDTNRWQAYICSSLTKTNLGCYDTEEEGARAYDKAALERAGEFACLNFPKQEGTSHVGHP